jgi:hypothetical protein
MKKYRVTILNKINDYKQREYDADVCEIKGLDVLVLKTRDNIVVAAFSNWEHVELVE